MLSRHMTDYPAVEEVLVLAAFSGCRILGGSAGCQRRVRGVNLTDTPDYARWLSPGELLLTTGFALAGDEAAIEALLILECPGTGLHRKKLCSGGWRPSAGTRAGCAA